MLRIIANSCESVESVSSVVRMMVIGVRKFLSRIHVSSSCERDFEDFLHKFKTRMIHEFKTSISTVHRSLFIVNYELSIFHYSFFILNYYLYSDFV